MNPQLSWDHALQILYPNLGVELPERSYGGDCRLYIPDKGINWESINSTLFDEFVIAHHAGLVGQGCHSARPTTGKLLLQAGSRVLSSCVQADSVCNCSYGSSPLV